MSLSYDKYLTAHKGNVKRGYEWFKKYLPDIIAIAGDNIETVIDGHDESKLSADEYNAYDAYFYGTNKSFSVIQEYDKAWLLHIHRNPHHWQYWVLIGDDDGTKPLEIPYIYIIEMICDWWSFSWNKKSLFEIFDWYEDHKNTMIMNSKTKIIVESILFRMKQILSEKEEIIK